MVKNSDINLRDFTWTDTSGNALSFDMTCAERIELRGDVSIFPVTTSGPMSYPVIFRSPDAEVTKNFQIVELIKKSETIASCLIVEVADNLRFIELIKHCRDLRKSAVYLKEINEKATKED